MGPLKTLGEKYFRADPKSVETFRSGRLGLRPKHENRRRGGLLRSRNDALGRVIVETKSGGGVRPDTTTTTTYDPEDRVLSRTVTSGGLSETETYEYDALGRDRAGGWPQTVKSVR